MAEPSQTDAAHPLIAAVDVGGTAIKAGLVAADGTVHHEQRHRTSAGRGPQAVVDTILDVAAELVARGGVSAVGLGVPGIVDSPRGVARYAANLGWHDVPFTDLISARLGVPAVLGHDVRNGALAEARIGAGAGSDSVYFMAIGTGIAGGHVRHGIVDDGATGQAGEIGHVVVRRGGPRCGCGNRGCVEAIASAARIAATYRRRSHSRANAADVARLVRDGDPLAVSVWHRAVQALAEALAAQIVIADPGCIVIGGGLSLAGHTLTDPLEAALRPLLTFRAPPPITRAKLGDRAGLIGAALRAMDVLDSGGTSASARSTIPTERTPG